MRPHFPRNRISVLVAGHLSSVHVYGVAQYRFHGFFQSPLDEGIRRSCRYVYIGGLQRHDEPVAAVAPNDDISGIRGGTAGWSPKSHTSGVMKMKARMSVTITS